MTDASPDISFDAMRILERVTDAFFSLDTEWRFTYLNPQAERLLQRTREDLLGKNLWHEFPVAVGSTFDQQYRRAVEEQTTVSFEAYYPPPLNAWFEVRAYPSADGLSVFFQNVTERKRSQDAVTESEERLRLATEGAGVGVWKLIPATNELIWTNRCCEIFGLPTDGSMTIPGELPWTLIHPEDVGGIRSAMERAVRENTSFNYEYRVLTASGETRWVKSSGKPYYDGEGEMVRVEGILMDSTSQREAAELLAAAYAKERHIAEELQAALTPPLPERVPGMAVTRYYEAALGEAGVGGDFWDVFSVEKRRTVLVLGDLSGKGLKAATQVATVRNMLRAFVYTRPSLAEAVTELNAVLAENNLLTGFTTLFVGCFDAGEHSLTYVNCGQEPGLVRRVGGTVEELQPTGPILGSIEGLSFSDRTVALGSGDVVAIFSDGLTEVGRSRQEMIGLEGVADLLAGTVIPAEADSAEAVAEHIALRLITGVDAAAQGGVMRDDVCLLVAVVE